MNPREVLSRAHAIGLRLHLEADGQVRMNANTPPPPELLAALRHHRDEVVRLLTERRGPHWARETAPVTRRVYQPGDPDPLRDGLLASARRYLPPLPSAARGRGAIRADGEY